MIPSKTHLKFENVTWVPETVLNGSLLLNGLFPYLTQNPQGQPKCRRRPEEAREVLLSLIIMHGAVKQVVLVIENQTYALNALTMVFM